MIDLKFEKLHEKAQLPTYAHEGDAGMDIYAVEDSLIGPGEQALVKTGLAVEIPFGYELQVRSRSGLCLDERVTVANQPGTIDHRYRKEIGVILHNSRTRGIFAVESGDRIAQLVLSEVPRANPQWTDSVENTDRGGWGSTGRK